MVVSQCVLGYDFSATVVTTTEHPGHPPMPGLLGPPPPCHSTQYDVLTLLVISLRSLSPNFPWKLPRRQIHLSSRDFSFPHSAHLHPGPGLWLAPVSRSCVVVMCSNNVILTLPRFGPSASCIPPNSGFLTLFRLLFCC